MSVLFEKRTKQLVRGTSFGSASQSKYEIKFRSMAMVSKEELIAALTKHNTKPKMKAKILTELTKRGVKLVWK